MQLSYHPLQTIDGNIGMSHIDERIGEIEDLKKKIEEEQTGLQSEVREELSIIVKQIDELEERKLKFEAFLGINVPLGEGPNSPKRRNVGTMNEVIEIVRQHPNGVAVRDVLDIILRDKLTIKPQSVSSSLSYAFDKGLVTRDSKGVYRVKE